MQRTLKNDDIRKQSCLEKWSVHTIENCKVKLIGPRLVGGFNHTIKQHVVKYKEATIGSDGKDWKQGGEWKHKKDEGWDMNTNKEE